MKRPRGRPRVEKPPKEIKKIGRPRTRPIPDPDAPKRGRGAPQKDNSEKKTVDIVQYRKNYYKMLKKDGSSTKTDLGTVIKLFIVDILKDISQAI